MARASRRPVRNAPVTSPAADGLIPALFGLVVALIGLALIVALETLRTIAQILAYCIGLGMRTAPRLARWSSARRAALKTRQERIRARRAPAAPVAAPAPVAPKPSRARRAPATGKTAPAPKRAPATRKSAPVAGAPVVAAPAPKRARRAPVARPSAPAPASPSRVVAFADWSRARASL